MRVLAIVAVFGRLAVWLLLLVKWGVDFFWAVIVALAKAAFYLARLLIGIGLRPLSHRFALIAVAIGVIVIAASDPKLQNPGFYGVFAVAVLGSFFAGKFGRLLLPRALPSFSGVFPPLPAWPTWPPIPKPRPRVKKPAEPPEIIPPPPQPEPASFRLPMPERPSASGVFVVASSAAMPAPSEQEAVAALPETLQRLMRPKDIAVTGAPVPPQTSERAAPE